MSNTRRENRLEELGRVDAEQAYTSQGKRNLKDEKKRIVRELKDKSKDRKKGSGSFKRKKPGPSPQPGTYDYFLQEMHKPEYKKENKASGGLIKGKPKLAKKGWK